MPLLLLLLPLLPYSWWPLLLPQRWLLLLLLLRTGLHDCGGWSELMLMWGNDARTPARDRWLDARRKTNFGALLPPPIPVRACVCSGVRIGV